MTDKSSYSELIRTPLASAYIFPAAADHHFTTKSASCSIYLTTPQRPAVLMLGRLLRQKEPMIWQPEAELVIIYLRAS